MPTEQPRADKPTETEVRNAVRALFNLAATGTIVAPSYRQVAAWLQQYFNIVE